MIDTMRPVPHACSDPWLAEATCAIEDTAADVAAAVDRKRAAAAKLMERYNPHKDPARQAALQRLLDSVADNQVTPPTPPLPLPCCSTTSYISSGLSVCAQAYLSFNVAPVQRALDILTTHFDPRRPAEPFSLELRPTPRKWSFGHGSFGMGFSSKVIMPRPRSRGRCLHYLYIR